MHVTYQRLSGDVSIANRQEWVRHATSFLVALEVPQGPGMGARDVPSWRAWQRRFILFRSCDHARGRQAASTFCTFREILALVQTSPNWPGTTSARYRLP